MLRKLIDRIIYIWGNLKTSMGISYHDFISTKGFKGELFITVVGVDGRLLDTRHIKNIITRDMSLLVSRLLKSNNEPLRGISMLAVGTGDVGWDLQNPPAPTNTQRSLYNEIARKGFATVNFVDAGGLPTAIPTNVVDFTTVYSETEAVGPLVEMGLLGGDANPLAPGIKNPILPPNGAYDPNVDVVGKDTLCNYLTFPVINKPATAVLTLTWRITT